MQTAKIFTNGRSQAVRLPASCRFETPEVYVHRDPETGDVVLSRRPPTWAGLVDAVRAVHEHNEFLSASERQTPPTNRDPFANSIS